MKKTIYTIIFILVAYFLLSNMVAIHADSIPNDAIRIRIIPNSNTNEDQQIKNKVKETIQTSMYNLLKDTKGSDNAKKTIEQNLDMIDLQVKNVLEQEKYKLGYKIHFGYNYFPEKTYKGITYEEGMYESLLITLGKGEGDNWWCVLFPPLCLLEAEESTEVEYKTFVGELIEKYL